MPNHFHMLVYIRDEAAATKFISSVMTAYTMYFNKKYKRRGPLCESRFKAVIILQNDQLMHITRYIHLNNSSYHDYAREHPRNWINSAPILELFTGKEAYLEFVDDYAELQRERDSIKKELAAG
jgi:putative transposase